MTCATSPERSTHTTTIRSDQLQPGDLVAYHGQLHLVTRITCGDGWAWPIATDDTGWAIALGHDLTIIHPRLDLGAQRLGAATVNARIDVLDDADRGI